MPEFLTQEGYQNIREKLDGLKGKRKEIAKDLEESSAVAGDEEDNIEYQHTRNEQALLEKKIRELKNKLDEAYIIRSENGNGKVQIGSKVKVTNGEGQKEFHIVGPSEANPDDGKISYESPIGKALVNKRPGEIATFETPDGDRLEFQVAKVV